MLIPKTLVLLCILLAYCVFSAPVDDDDDDIILTDEQKRDFRDEKMIQSTAIPDKYKWPHTPDTHLVYVPIVINTNQFKKTDLDVLRQGIADIEKKTCVRFIDRKTQKDYIYIYDGGKGKCNGRYGKVGGKQDIQLTPECMRIRKKCVHEFIHALGFHHMHQRFDRDKALNILWQNIEEKNKQWFEKFNNKWEAFNTRYDLYSCMHYAKDGFSKNGENTIVPMNRTFLDKIGKQLTLSNGDATRINRMYNCPAPYK